ncbi:hypothetical protein [Ralstonia phage RSP15]|uniref:protease n=1 Tax=Ralstonia phage RSP15 TaxID=1785960 RepID=UPI00074D2E51|nr:protease [Ralstonia phage RSP15]BAU39986.1 hypothetical protein [Ralstonia phage RSP15]
MKDSTVVKIALAVIFATASMIGGCMYGQPHYKVYQQRLEGEAELAKAETSKRVLVQEAQAKLDSATLQAKAEVERAKGVAEANKIIGDSLKGNDAYLKYLWLSKLDDVASKGQVIYVPTEAGIPITESGRAMNK